MALSARLILNELIDAYYPSHEAEMMRAALTDENVFQVKDWIDAREFGRVKAYVSVLHRTLMGWSPLVEIFRGGGCE